MEDTHFHVKNLSVPAAVGRNVTGTTTVLTGNYRRRGIKSRLLVLIGAVTLYCYSTVTLYSYAVPGLSASITNNLTTNATRLLLCVFPWIPMVACMATFIVRCFVPFLLL